VGGGGGREREVRDLPSGVRPMKEVSVDAGTLEVAHGRSVEMVAVPSMAAPSTAVIVARSNATKEGSVNVFMLMRRSFGDL